MNTSLKYAQTVSFFFCMSEFDSHDSSYLQALHLQPSDKAIVYNIAMIEQKAAEMLFAVNPSKRSLKDMQRAIDQAGHAQKWVQ
jgi:hypothetical protein